MKKILIVNTVNFGKNGISTAIMNYYTNINCEVFKMDFVVNQYIDPQYSKIMQDKQSIIYTLRRSSKGLIKYIFSLAKIVRAGGYDIVHVHGNSCTMAFELLAAMLGGCKVRIAHSHNTTCEHNFLHNILKPVFYLCCNGHFACGEAAGKWLYGNREYYVINNGIDLEKYSYDNRTRELLRRKLGIENNFVIGHVGGFNYQKNHEFFVELIKDMKTIIPNAKLILVGDGEKRREIEYKFTELGLRENVMFTGNVANVCEFMQVFDVFVLPSRYEGLPFVLIEAQASGLHCYVSDCITREVDFSGDTNFLPINNAENWKREVYDFYKRNNKNERATYSLENQKKIRDKGYDIESNLEMIEKLYLELFQKYSG